MIQLKLHTILVCSAVFDRRETGAKQTPAPVAVGNKAAMEHLSSWGGSSTTARKAGCDVLVYCPAQEPAQEAVGNYADALTQEYNARMASKMGLRSYQRDLSVQLLSAMYTDRADFTNTFRALADVSVADETGSIPEAIRRVGHTKRHLTQAYPLCARNSTN